MTRGSITLARSLCFEIAGDPTGEDDFSGPGYGSVDIAEILSEELVRLRGETQAMRDLLLTANNEIERKRDMLKNLYKHLRIDTLPDDLYDELRKEMR